MSLHLQEMFKRILKILWGHLDSEFRKGGGGNYIFRLTFNLMDSRLMLGNKDKMKATQATENAEVQKQTKPIPNYWINRSILT